MLYLTNWFTMITYLSLYYFNYIDGHYLNLPVVDNGNILGMVDVLKLTYATMEQVNIKLIVLS